MPGLEHGERKPAQAAAGGEPPSRARGIWTLALLDLQLLAREKAALFWTLAFPLALMWIFGLAFGGLGRERGGPLITLGVVLEDRGFMGKVFLEHLAGEGVEVRELAAARPDTTAGEEGEDRPRTLYIPADFTARLLATERVELRLERPEEGNLHFDQAAEIRVWRAVIRLLADLVEFDRARGHKPQPAGGAASGTAAAAGAAAPAPDDPELARLFHEIAARPSIVTVDARDAGHGRPVPSGFGQSVPGTLTMSILMMTVIYGALFLTAERTSGALRRQATVPLSRVSIMTGKILGRLLIALTQAIILLAAGKFLFGVYWGRSAPGLALVVLAFCACAAACGLLFGAVLRTPEQAGSVGWIAPLFLAALGGCWWPLEVVPRWLRLAGHISPAAWAMDAFHRLSSFGEGLGAVWLPSIVLFAYAAVLTLLAARFLRWE